MQILTNREEAVATCLHPRPSANVGTDTEASSARCDRFPSRVAGALTSASAGQASNKRIPFRFFTTAHCIGPYVVLLRIPAKRMDGRGLLGVGNGNVNCREILTIVASSWNGTEWFIAWGHAAAVESDSLQYPIGWGFLSLCGRRERWISSFTRRFLS